VRRRDEKADKNFEKKKDAGLTGAFGASGPPQPVLRREAVDHYFAPDFFSGAVFCSVRFSTSATSFHSLCHACRSVSGWLASVS
jgi:hypothetical protein